MTSLPLWGKSMHAYPCYSELSYDHEDFLSDCFKSFDPAATVKYSAKLRFLTLTKKDDPFIAGNDEKYVNDMRLWPPVEFAHIFSYFIDHPGVNTCQQLMRWKSM